MFYATIWALLPPVVAIALALITKEVYSSLFLGIVVGAALVAGFAPVKTLDVIINDGFIAGVADAWNVGHFPVPHPARHSRCAYEPHGRLGGVRALGGKARAHPRRARCSLRSFSAY